MVSKSRWNKNVLNIPKQTLWLQRDFPNGSIHKGQKRVVWSGRIQPSPLSQEYTIAICYSLGQRPMVKILEPELIKLKGMSLPHVYKNDELCLYFPGQWNGETPITQSIIPWTSEWLLHYEIWLATGEWCGGGVHPSIKKKSAVEENELSKS